MSDNDTVDDVLSLDMSAEDERREAERREALAARVEAFGASLCKTRDEAINGRKQSGIEDEWRKCDDAYQGIDAATAMNSGKPSGTDGGYINGPAKGPTRSTVFLNITRPYVDASAARVSDMLLPTDDRAWGIKPTPITSAAEGVPQVETQQASPETAPVQPQAGAPQAGLMGQVQPPPQAMSPVAAAVEAATKAADGATKQIEDWHIECQWHAEMRKAIEDCARLGTLVLKGPTPVRRTSRVAKMTDGGLQIVLESKIKPASKAISPWKFYPDPGCGENIQDGAYCWEEDSLTARALAALKGLPGYIDAQIDKVLEEPPGAKRTSAPTQRLNPSDKDNYPVWYGYCVADRDDLVAAGVKVPDDGPVSCPCVVTIANDHVIRASLNPLDSGDFPYDVMPWVRKSGVPWGTGVADQIETPQRMLNAATRNLMDNSGLSSGPQIVMRKGAILPADNSYELTPRKVWYAQDGFDVTDVRGAFTAFDIPSMQPELMGIIQFALKMAEDVTGMPMMMQGQQSPTTPETLGGQIMQQNNASVVLRRIARLFDDRVTEPHIRRYYEWLLMYGDDDSIKGDFQIDARGSTALVERDIQNQAVIQMGNIVMNPAFEIDPAKWAEEALRAQRLDPKRFKLSDEKKRQLAQQPPPKAPAVEAAEIRANAAVQTAQISAEASVQRSQLDTDRDSVYVQAENDRTQLEHEARMAELAQRERLAMLEYANKNNATLEQIKADLAKTVLKINSVKELAGMKASADTMPTPPVEPAGRAQPGMSYQQ